MTETIQYLLSFMLGEQFEGAGNLIGYTDDEARFSDYKIVIVPSDFFKQYGSHKTKPALPLDTIENVPFLFGTPKMEKTGNTLVVYADLVASAYFLLSRYEELINPQRDKHGRFEGYESLPYRAGFINRPIVDEYGKLLRSWLRDSKVDAPEPPKKIKKIYLTHDVDVPYIYRTLRQLGGAFFKRQKEILPALKTFFGKRESDPFFTFPFILEQNKCLSEALETIDVETIFFLRSGKYEELYDRPYYDLQSKDIQYLITLIKQSGATIGLHTSYTAGQTSSLALQENNMLRNAVSEQVVCNRYHWLRSTDPQEMLCLPFAGISDDFTLGYPDVAGFRLGTSRPVAYIDLKTQKVSEHLTLHPLTVMDCTLSNKHYMNLDYKKAFKYAAALIDQVKEHSGELVLLWHNSIFAEQTFDHKKFYPELLKYIKDNQ